MSPKELDARTQIVPIAVKFAEGFRECLDVVGREKKYLALVEAPPLPEVAAFIAANVRNDIAQFVALDGERVVGWADITPSWGQAHAHTGTLGMGVLPEYRGRGIGERLLGATLAKAAASGITRVELAARVDNAPAIALYEKFGFKREGVKRGALRFDGVYYDAVLMARVNGKR